ncbi:hypothetical protein DH2020_041610 [Rehmannia glutinosa]|uniref:ARM repeat superfamily protein n=1 Tax=Rehmannia glutinosa TaxID=99300 RepID=A0ABR0URL7_REHGL
MEQEEEQQLIGIASASNSGPMVSATLGRVMTTLLKAKLKKLQDAILRLHSPPQITPLTVSLEQSLWFLHKYIGEASEKGEPLDQVLVPILQHVHGNLNAGFAKLSLAYCKISAILLEFGLIFYDRWLYCQSLTLRESKQGNQSLILLNWLFQDEVLFQAIMRNMAAIILRRDDRYLALGWCFLGRSLIEYENVVDNVSANAISEKYDVILETFCSCVTHLLSIICNGSNMQEGYELPTRLAVAAADFILSLTVALTKKDPASNKITKKQKLSSVYVKTQTLNLLPSATNDGDENTLRKASELSSSLELKLLLWNNLNELITLVKKLTAYSLKKNGFANGYLNWNFTMVFLDVASGRCSNELGIHFYEQKLQSCMLHGLIYQLKLNLVTILRTLMMSVILLGSFRTELLKHTGRWSRKSRSLHAKGLERVFKWLQEIKQHYGCFQDEAESQMLTSGSLLLSSCWKHYGMLLRLEDPKFSQQHKELLDQYLSGIQFYADNQAEEPSMSRNSKSETINFFLNCLLLLLGRLDNQQFGNAITEYGSQISQVLMSQLRCADEEVIDGTISIFKAVILRTNHTLSTRSLGDIRQMDSLLPILLNLLDERDAAAKAIVKLLAEHCSICSDSKCLYEVLKHIDSKNVAQRRNAVDFVADLIHMSSGSVNALTEATWMDVANRLLECLGDEDQIIQNQAANLIPMIDPMLVLPTLVDLSYSTHKSVQISASNALMALLVNHKQKPEILCMLLDCLSKLSRNPDSGAPNSRKEGSTFDADRILKLLSEWAKHVDDWHVMVGPLIDKMLDEPSNAVIVRFLSHISEYLAEAVDVVFNRLIVHMREQKEIDECFSIWKGRTDTNIEAMKREHCLFSRLCPLLVIRLLPLRVFDDLNSPIVYGECLRNSNVHDGHFSIKGTEYVAALMINRALSKSEFEDVRKLAAELCGRIHPEVLIPNLSSQLEFAASTQDVLTIKVCLFSFCTSLMVRGNSVYMHPDLFRIKKTIRKVLSWPSVDGDEISKAQHGCIDCLALMLCSELQEPKSSKGTANNGGSVLSYVINQLTSDEEDIFFEYDGGDKMAEATSRLSFRLCMANVLISACKKISDTGKKPFIRKILPRVVRSLGAMMDPEIRAACIQVLFAVAYHLKSWIFPYSNDLLSVVLKSLKEESLKEKTAGAKLLTCLMASEEEVVETISDRLLEARTLLQELSATDPSPDLRLMCQQLLGGGKKENKKERKVVDAAAAVHGYIRGGAAHSLHSADPQPESPRRDDGASRPQRHFVRLHRLPVSSPRNSPLSLPPPPRHWQKSIPTPAGGTDPTLPSAYGTV